MFNLVKMFLISLTVCLVFLLPSNANAETFIWSNAIANTTSNSVDVVVLGHNTTKGTTQNLPYTVSTVSGYYSVTYIVPNDGCTWNIYASITLTGRDNAVIGLGATYQTTVTTNGSFSGPSVVDAINTASTAATYASQANTNASTAASRAQTAINQTWYSGAYGGSQESVGNVAGYIRMLQLTQLTKC